mgnify:CR=1 FL=1
MKKKTPKDKTTMTASEVGVLIESLRSEFRTFNDAIQTINRSLDALEKTAARTWEKITEINLRLIKVEKKVDEIDARMIRVETMLTTQDTRITQLETLK